jgi:hypothetical protein
MALRVAITAFTLVLVALAGCGEPTYKVTGTVQFEGKPIENGSIAFESADGGPGVASSGITKGKYELQSKAGKKKVLILARRVRPGTENDPQPAMEEFIPARYNSESELFREVKAGVENRVDFELKK